MANAFLKIADTPLGHIVTQITLLTGLLWGGTGLIKAMKIIPNLFTKAAEGVKALGIASKITAPHLALISTAIVGIIALAPKIRELFDEVYKHEQVLEDLNEELETNKTRLEELNKIPVKNRGEGIRDEITLLKQANAELKQKIELEQQEIDNAKKKDRLAEISTFAKYGKVQTNQLLLKENIGRHEDVAQVYDAQDALDLIVQRGYRTREIVNEILANVNGDAKEALRILGYDLEESFEKIKPEEFLQHSIINLGRVMAQFQKDGKITPDFIESYEKYSTIFRRLAVEFQDFSEEDLAEAGLGWIIPYLNYAKTIPETNRKIADSYYTVGESLGNLGEGYAINDIQLQQLEDAFPGLIDILDKTDAGWVSNTNSLGEMLEEMGKVNPAIKELSDGYNALISGAGATEKQQKALIAQFPELSKVIRQNKSESEGVAGAYYIDAQALVDLANTGNSWAIAMIAQQKGVTTASLRATQMRLEALYKEVGAMTAYYDKMSPTAKQLFAASNPMEMARIQQLKGYQSYLKKALSIGSGDLGVDFNGLYLSKDGLLLNKNPSVVEKEEDKKGTGTSKTPSNPALDAFNLSQKELKHKLEMDLITEVQYYDELEKLVNKYLRSEKANAQDMYRYQEEIYKGRKKLAEDLAQKKEELAEEEKRRQEEAKKEAEKRAEEERRKQEEAAEAAKQAQIDALEAQKDALQEVNNQLDEQLQLEEALEALAKARNKQVRVYKDGRWQYTQDVDAVSQAQQAVNDILRNQSIANQIEAIDKQIEAIRNGAPIGAMASATNLRSMGVSTPSSMMSSFSGGIQSLGQSIGITIQNFNPSLPNVTDGEGFANYLRNNFWRDTMQFAKI